MIIWRDGVVRRVGRSWPGVQELEVELTGAAQVRGAGPWAAEGIAPSRDDPAPAGDVADPLPRGTTVRALAYPRLVGEVRAGDRVTLTASALARGLGTGGYALVAAVPDRLPADPPTGPGHLVKARYTPTQPLVLGVDEQESASHDVLRDADDLGGMPVVVADLHSALPAIIAGARAEAAFAGAPLPRVAYVMTDGGALPAWVSRTVAELRAAGWLEAAITVGQAFGGDLEAVTVHTGLLAARHVLGVDLVVVAQGPGNLGTGTRWGFSGVAAGEALNATHVLGGRPVASLRVSGADPRDRHLGVSHHSLTAYGRVALAASDVVVPVLGGPLGDRVTGQAATLGGPGGRHRLVRVACTGLLGALRGSPVRLSTMGRGLDDDPAPFLAAATAGRWATRVLSPARGRIWHLALADDWAAAETTGGYTASTRGARLAEAGFVHCSYAEQVDGIAAAVYPDAAGVVLLEVDADALAADGVAVVAEPGDPDEPGGERYPHVYGPVPITAIVAARPWRGSFAATVA